MKQWRIWIDDQAFDVNTPDRHPPKDWNTDDVLGAVATSADEAICLTQDYGCAPCFMELDHDLGDSGNVMKYLKWLSEVHYEFSPDYNVHSRNGEGTKNIISFMESWKKSLQ